MNSPGISGLQDTCLVKAPLMPWLFCQLKDMRFRSTDLNLNLIGSTNNKFNLQLQRNGGHVLQGKLLGTKPPIEGYAFLTVFTLEKDNQNLFDSPGYGIY